MMTAEEKQCAFKAAFGRLDEEHLGNLLFHAEQKTPVCCGKDAWLYADGSGGM
jgi:hypothetical protein